jgi:hypothetical protein
LVDPVSNQWPNVGTIRAKLLGCVRFRTKGIIFEVCQGSDWAASTKRLGSGRANARRCAPGGQPGGSSQIFRRKRKTENRFPGFVRVHLLLDIFASGNPRRIALHHGPLFLPDIRQAPWQEDVPRWFNKRLRYEANSKDAPSVLVPAIRRIAAASRKAAGEPPFFFAVSRSLR